MSSTIHTIRQGIKDILAGHAALTGIPVRLGKREITDTLAASIQDDLLTKGVSVIVMEAVGSTRDSAGPSGVLLATVTIPIALLINPVIADNAAAGGIGKESEEIEELIVRALLGKSVGGSRVRPSDTVFARVDDDGGPLQTFLPVEIDVKMGPL